MPFLFAKRYGEASTVEDQRTMRCSVSSTLISGGLLLAVKTSGAFAFMPPPERSECPQRRSGQRYRRTRAHVPAADALTLGGGLMATSSDEDEDDDDGWGRHHHQRLIKSESWPHCKQSDHLLQVKVGVSAKRTTNHPSATSSSRYLPWSHWLGFLAPMDTKCSGFIRVESSTCPGINKSNGGASSSNCRQQSSSESETLT